jgi:hypothetical protein
MTRSVELKLYAYRKNRDGLIVSFVVHPSDEDFLNGIHIGQVYQASLEPNGEEAYIPLPDGQLVRAKTEGERLRTRAVLLCKDERFQKWATRDKDGTEFLEPTEENARVVLCEICEIDSRSELALSIPGQAKFRELLDRYLRETGQAAERRGG